MRRLPYQHAAIENFQRARQDEPVDSLFVEGGGRTAANFLQAGLIDEVYHVIAPRYLGGRDAVTGLEGRGWDSPDAGPQLVRAESFPLGDNLVVHGFLPTAGHKAWLR